MILKGGVLVAALVGLNNRSTLDVDATLKHLPLNEETAKRIINDIIAIQVDDGMSFEIRRVVPIMDEADYPGIRILLDTMLETMRTPINVTWI